MDEYKTMVNTLTTADMDRAKIPVTLADDQALIELISGRYGDHRWMFIPNTLHLGELYVTADLRDELREHSLCRVNETPVPLSYSDGRCTLPWKD